MKWLIVSLWIGGGPTSVVVPTQHEFATRQECTVAREQGIAAPRPRDNPQFRFRNALCVPANEPRTWCSYFGEDRAARECAVEKRTRR